MSVELKHRKLCNKLHTETSSYVKICTRRRPRKSKWHRDTSFSVKNWTSSRLTVDTICRDTSH